jgi:hypothetical protein
LWIGNWSHPRQARRIIDTASGASADAVSGASFFGDRLQQRSSVVGLRSLISLFFFLILAKSSSESQLIPMTQNFPPGFCLVPTRFFEKPAYLCLQQIRSLRAQVLTVFLVWVQGAGHRSGRLSADRSSTVKAWRVVINQNCVHKINWPRPHVAAAGIIDFLIVVNNFSGRPGAP